MAYSSCSINQIENEAVVAQLLREAKGSLELVDMSGRFPGLNWLPGLSKWKVFDNLMQVEIINKLRVIYFRKLDSKYKFLILINHR